jgi:hypothetical protein
VVGRVKALPLAGMTNDQCPMSNDGRGRCGVGSPRQQFVVVEIAVDRGGGRLVTNRFNRT